MLVRIVACLALLFLSSCGEDMTTKSVPASFWWGIR